MPADFSFERCFSVALFEISIFSAISEAVTLGLFLIISKIRIALSPRFNDSSFRETAFVISSLNAGCI
jgi:hypothetical protein